MVNSNIKTIVKSDQLKLLKVQSNSLTFKTYILYLYNCDIYNDIKKNLSKKVKISKIVKTNDYIKFVYRKPGITSRIDYYYNSNLLGIKQAVTKGLI